MGDGSSEPMVTWREESVKVVLVQRVYPVRDDSRQFKVFARDGSLTVTNMAKWEMDASNPW